MPIRIAFIPNFSAFCAGGFVCSALVTLLLVSVGRGISQRSVDDYGNALAGLAARQAVDATFNHDLVRLQVILSDVVQNPQAVFAAIHDVQNNLLVQAGEPHRLTKQRQTFNSPITVHDSVAGYVSVAIDGRAWSMRSASVLSGTFSLLMLVLALWSMLRQNAVVWQQSAARDKDTPEAACTDNGEFDTVHTVPQPPLPCVYAVIHIKNLNVLQQQLNGASFRETMGRLESIISDVMALYGGHSFELIDNYYVLSFSTHHDRGEALFNASCGAYLILELAGILDKIPLDLAALVSANEEDIVPTKLPFAGLILEATAGAEALINRRIEFMEVGTEDGRRVVANFRQPFDSLLENQRKQLATIL